MRKPKQELICALDHLVKAKELLKLRSWSVDIYAARGDVRLAIDYARGALELLKQEALDKTAESEEGEDASTE